MQRNCLEISFPGTTLTRMNLPIAKLAVTRTVIVVPYGSDLLSRCGSRAAWRPLPAPAEGGGHSGTLDGQLAAAAAIRPLALDDTRALGHVRDEELADEDAVPARGDQLLGVRA